MKTKPRFFFVAAALIAAIAAAVLIETPESSGHQYSRATAPPEDGKLRIIGFGAHPDDNEFDAGGTAALWAEQGHHVKFVSVTNGDIGHFQIAGGPLAQRRTAEVQRCADILGIATQVLDIHDGELMPTLENRQTITRLIREWDADIVMAHRPNDYHPDHRYTGVLVQDAAFMVTVPFFTPDTQPLDRNPVFVYYYDSFQKPNPFTADIAVSIDDVFQKKIDAVDALVSQVYEGGALGSEELLRRVPTEPDQRRAWAEERHGARYARVADSHRDALARWYGEEKGRQVKYAEVFEICEYGRQPSQQEIKRLFPFFPDSPRE
jgi:LmbE family N-acetylglucosaminyl deacetylase